jgi:hypothetical protein
MVDKLRTIIAKFIAQHVQRPPCVVAGAWRWLAAQTGNVEEEKRCLWAVLDLDADNTRALLGLLALVQQEGDG